jgi:hypothetical protein
MPTAYLPSRVPTRFVPADARWLDAGQAGREAASGLALRPASRGSFPLEWGAGLAAPWAVEYPRHRADPARGRFRARFWQLAIPALALFWASIAWAIVG